MNRVTLIGNLTKDIEIRNVNTAKGATLVGNGSVATNKSYFDASGQKQTISQFHNFVVWGKQAEALAKYTSKGDKIFIEGELTHRQWEKDGIKRTATEIQVSNFEFLPNGQRQERSQTSQQPYQPEAQSYEQPSYDEEIQVENIPF